ncbi:MAG: cellulase family glycosylhydrolase [Armatimonadetes bacterium]|nr:cellulase family glycosylhydrolase [Armatimonadota bacterium]
MIAPLTALVCLLGLAAGPSRLPSGPLPDGLGVNIHFTDPRPGEMKMMAEAGVTWVRMDFDWNQVEFEKGKYRFDAYDRLMTALKPHGIRPIFILDYVHRFYDDAQSPHSDEAVAAFAAFAAASAKHFVGQGVVWEMYNEPNILPFWRPKPNVRDYIRLATAVGEAIRKATPKETYIGPATSGIDYGFLEACFAGGLLKYWDAVSVHPYRPMPPETAAGDYSRLRAMIARRAPRGKRIPIISGEWGYSSIAGSVNPAVQARYLARQWLTNVSCGVPLSIWYDWHDDGPDPKEPEHHFGTVLNEYHADRDPVYDPKPAYLAARQLTSFLRGHRFNKRLQVGGADNYILLFNKGRDVRVVAWTTSTEPRQVTLPASPGSLEVTDHLGRRLDDVQATGPGAELRLTDAPLYIRPSGRNRVLSVAADWETLGDEWPTGYAPRVQVGATIRNGGAEGVTLGVRGSAVALAPGASHRVAADVDLQRSEMGPEVRLSLSVDGSAPLVQSTKVVVTNPLVASVEPPRGGKVAFTLADPGGNGFTGSALVTVEVPAAPPRTFQRSIKVKGGSDAVRWVIPAELGVAGQLRVTAEVRDKAGRRVLAMPPVAYRPVVAWKVGVNDVSKWIAVLPDGDAKVSSEQTLSVVAASGPDAPSEAAVQLKYRFASGWKFVCVRTLAESERGIEGKPKAMGAWVHGDGQANQCRARFVDATSQTFQPDGETISWTGWRWVVFPMDGARSGRWGGADDGVIHYPIRWDSLFLLDSPGGRATQGQVLIAGPTLIY